MDGTTGTTPHTRAVASRRQASAASRPDGRSGPSPRLTRRTLLLGGAAAVVLSACGKEEKGEGDDDPITATTLSEGSLAVRAFFDPSPSYAKAGHPQRLTFGLFDFEGAPYDGGPEELSIDVFFEGTPTQSNTSMQHRGLYEGLTAPRFDTDIPRPYYALRLTPEQTGIYTVETTVEGQDLSSVFQVGTTDEPGPLQIGQPMVPHGTATTADPLGVDPICTLEPEACPFHEESLDVALDSGNPVALLIGTPAYCQTGICGPVLELLVEAAPEHPGVRFVHSEVYKAPQDGDPTAGGLVSVLEAYGLTFEPVLFLSDASGTCVERLDNIYDRVELETALGQLTA